MSNLAFDDGVRRLRESSMEFFGSKGATDEQIEQIELNLNVNIPMSYKKFLTFFGNLVFEGREIYGWTASGFDAKSVPSVLFATKSLRERGIISETMIHFMDSGFGPSFVIDCSKMNNDREAPIYEVPAGGISYGCDKRADSFGEFFLKKVNEAILELSGADASNDEPEGGNPSAEWIKNYWKNRSNDFS
ncbi:SMI1/KNR4 family protein [Jiella sp. MQZ9-1]|uniref:SMI1/KNR4 family protein n=1 Tax=Jiella flava TaxID=2816857 RepID=A0A939JXG9_9HYPH|nr:SMI1/KNR4 family protein [Jiella flava]MBO0664579.1 SMI1/KNR4 family protein [Jiella flava]MCD2473216.1 SMI1/KNR4 family protein [Jiella flava]